jgi:type VI secretion system protein ImpK
MQLVDTLIPVIALVTQTRGAATAQPAVPSTSHAASLTPAAASVSPSRDGGAPFVPSPVASVAARQTVGAVQESAVATVATPPAPADHARPSIGTQQSEGATSAQQLARVLDQQIASARRTARENNFVPSEFDSALFALLAWADEALITASWPGAPYWQRHLLQRQHFNVTTAGVEFYSRLDDLRKDQAQVREVYALCLSLGFKGRYASAQLSRQLDERRRTTLQQVLDSSELPAGMSALLFPGGYESDPAAGFDPARIEPAARRSRWQPQRQTVIGFGAPLLVLAVLYSAYHLIITQTVNEILPRIP